jgi:hypothetical protein
MKMKLKIINLEKLSLRRQHASAIFMQFLTLHDGIKSQEPSNEIVLSPNRQTRNSRYLRENDLSLYSFNAPFDRSIRLFNSFISCYY